MNSLVSFYIYAKRVRLGNLDNERDGMNWVRTLLVIAIAVSISGCGKKETKKIESRDNVVTDLKIGSDESSSDKTEPDH